MYVQRDIQICISLSIYVLDTYIYVETREHDRKSPIGHVSPLLADSARLHSRLRRAMQP